MKRGAGYECQWALVEIEGKEVRVMLDFDLESFPCPALSFKREGATGDVFAEMVGWKNPAAAMRRVAEAALLVCRESGVTEVSFAPFCERRLAVYVRLAKKLGLEPRLFQWSTGDFGAIVNI